MQLSIDRSYPQKSKLLFETPIIKKNLNPGIIGEIEDNKGELSEMKMYERERERDAGEREVQLLTPL